MPIDSRITLQKLDIFALVVELGGITNAADRLLVSPPVVTAHVRSLEQRLGVKLFYREGRRLQLTEAGRAVLGWVTEVQRSTRELTREIDGLTGGHQGSVVLGASMTLGSYVLPTLLLAFQQERPLVTVRLDMPEAAHAIADTEAGNNDFSVVVLSEPLSERVLISELVGYEEMILVAPAEGLVSGDTITREELAGLPFVETPRNLVRRAFADRHLARLGIRERRISLELGTPEAIKQAVLAGAGIGLLFRSAVVRELADGRAREIHVDGAYFTAPIHVVRRKDKALSPVHLDLIDAVRAHFAPTLAAVR